jgi:MFS family permease
MDTTSKSSSSRTPLTLNTWRFGAITGAPFMVGSATGLLVTDPLSEYTRLGRCGAIFIAGVISFATVIASASIHKWWELLICRCVLGVGMAGKASLVPILLSETAPKHMRGFLVMLWQLLDAGGIAISSAVNISVYHLNLNQSWRWMFIAAGIPALLLFSLVLFCQGRTNVFYT